MNTIAKYVYEIGQLKQINKIIQPPVGADLSRTWPIDRPSGDGPVSG